MERPDISSNPPIGASVNVGVLLLHGLASSPGFWDETKVGLEPEGFVLSVPELEGHGSEATALSDIKWTDWTDCVHRAYQSLRQDVSHVFIIGHSLGASLAFYSAALGDKPDGIILMAPSVGMNWKIRVGLATFGHVVKSVPLRKFDINRQGIVRSPNLGATRMPISAVRATAELNRVVDARLSQVTCPVLIISGRQDRVVPPGSAEYIFHSIASSNRDLVTMENSRHAIPMDLDREAALHAAVGFIRNIVAPH